MFITVISTLNNDLKDIQNKTFYNCHIALYVIFLLFISYLSFNFTHLFMFTLVHFMTSYIAKVCVVYEATGNFNNLGKDNYLLDGTNGIICKQST